MATIAYEAIAVVGKKKDGSPHFARVGTVFESSKGLALKMDSIPAGNEWNGWISLKPPRSQEAA